MSGFMHVPVEPHVCKQPDVVTFGPIVGEGRSAVPFVSKLAIGTVWQCPDCGLVWVVRYVPPILRGGYSPEGRKWRRETRRERRKRLGLRWWQREGSK